MIVPDPIELGEDAMERWADENVRGDHFRCSECGLWQPLAFAVQATPNPYSPAICGNCAFASYFRRTSVVSELTMLDFIAERMYQRDCARRNTIGARWDCLRAEVKKRYLRDAQESFDQWVAEQKLAQAARESGNPRAFFASTSGDDHGA